MVSVCDPGVPEGGGSVVGADNGVSFETLPTIYPPVALAAAPIAPPISCLRESFFGGSLGASPLFPSIYKVYIFCSAILTNPS